MVSVIHNLLCGENKKSPRQAARSESENPKEHRKVPDHQAEDYETMSMKLSVRCEKTRLNFLEMLENDSFVSGSMIW